MNTGTAIAGALSMGSWMTMDFGAGNREPAGFVCLEAVVGGRNPQPNASRQWVGWFFFYLAVTKASNSQFRRGSGPIIQEISSGRLALVSKAALIDA